jgi:hypothetical protein
MTGIHVLHTPMHEHRREDAGIKWCFACRKHLSHTAVLWVCDDPLSYYDPHWSTTCTRCGQNRTNFPGTCW